MKKNKKQSYCNAPECKQAKKSARKKERYQTDPSYRQRHLDRQKLWRSNRPAHEYQKQYRESHPEYVDLNRELQTKRNCRRKNRTAPVIVNGTPLSLQASNDKAYAIISVKRGKIVNGTPFLAQMQILTGKEAVFRQISN
ncbi:MAG: hypothetical protein DRI98_11835 [Bacteroidetes bacterium]|nr:MAG: hypothetical protein DRI98_11835 [Bacteroidota bacterium]